MKRVLTLLVICAVGVALVGGPQSAFAQKKIDDLNYPKLNEFEIPQPEKVVLDNGLVVYLLEDHELPLVRLSARLNCGAYLEPAGKVGLASICGNVMRTGGTKTWTGDEIDDELESIGATVETSIGTTSGSAFMNILSDYAETGVHVLSEVLRHPQFDPDKIELAKTEERAGISRRNDEATQVNSREFRKLIYGADSPYGRHTEYSTVEAVTRDDLVKFHNAFVHPNNTQLAIWGDFNRSEILALVSKYFGDWAKSDIAIPPPPDVDYDFKPTVNYAEKTDVNQTNVLVGHIGGRMGDPDYPATIVMNSILGGAFGSRLFSNVRSKEGLAYAVGGRYSFNFERPGVFYALVRTKSGSSVQAIESVMRQIRGMQTDPPTEDELSRAKNGYLNSFVFQFDTKGEVIRRMMTYDHFDFPLDYLQEVKEGVEKVTAEDVVAVAKRKLDPDNVQIMVTGNAEEFDKPLASLGHQVNVIDITIPAPAEEEFGATPGELAQGMDHLKQCVQACGGLANFQSVKDRSVEAAMTVTMPQGAMTMEVASLTVYPDKVRQTVKTPMGQQVMVFDGTSGWTQMGEMTQAMPSAQADEMRADMSRDLVRLFMTSNEPDYQVAFKGTEEFDGKQSVRLDFLTSAGSQFKMYVDPGTHHPVGMRYMGQTMTGPGEVTKTFADFKTSSGVLLPTKIGTASGEMSQDVAVSKTTINGGYDESLFVKPGNL